MTIVERKLLLTGFGPFPGVPDNPSAALVCALARSAPAGTSSTAHILPVDWNLAARDLCCALERVRPDIVLMFGVSRKATGFRIERFAFNRLTPRADASDFIPRSGRAEALLPKRMESRLPAAALARSLRSGGWPAHVSNSAGRYLCNFSYLHALSWSVARQSAPLVGFIHIPLPSLDGGMTLAQIESGAAEIVSFATACYAQPTSMAKSEASECWTGAG